MKAPTKLVDQQSEKPQNRKSKVKTRLREAFNKIYTILHQFQKPIWEPNSTSIPERTEQTHWQIQTNTQTIRNRYERKLRIGWETDLIKEMRRPWTTEMTQKPTADQTSKTRSLRENQIIRKRVHCISFNRKKKANKVQLSVQGRLESERERMKRKTPDKPKYYFVKVANKQITWTHDFICEVAFSSFGFILSKFFALTSPLSIITSELVMDGQNVVQQFNFLLLYTVLNMG